MSILDGTLARIAGAPDTVVGLSKDLGLDPSTVERAIMILTRTFVGEGDTIANAAAQTGLSAAILNDIIAKLGGEAALSEMADSLSAGLNGLGRGNFFKELLPFG